MDMATQNLLFTNIYADPSDWLAACLGRPPLGAMPHPAEAGRSDSQGVLTNHSMEVAMKRMNRWIMPAAMMFGMIAAAPSRAHAECSGDYLSCLNDTWYTSGILRTMADISCFAGYVGCVKDLLLE